MKYKIATPAKINIGLRVLSKRKDGYHNIETIFYPVKIFDEILLDIRTARENVIRVNSDSEEIPRDKKNVCYRAADLFLKEFRIAGVSVIIRINKKIPVGAGLGGGSSDAAAVLVGLYRHFKRQIVSQRAGIRIQKLADKLGSDIAYFLNYKSGIPNNARRTGAAYATGKGEKLVRLRRFKVRHPILIVFPGVHVSTKWAYSKIKNQKSKIKTLITLKKFSTQNLLLLRNDFEEVVFGKYPAIKEVKDTMFEKGAMFSVMSGSGSAVYGIFKNPAELERCKRFFEKKNYKVFVSK